MTFGSLDDGVCRDDAPVMRDRGFCNQCGTVYAPGESSLVARRRTLVDDVVTHDTIGRAEVAWLATMAVLVVFAIAYVALMGHPRVLARFIPGESCLGLASEAERWRFDTMAEPSDELMNLIFTGLDHGIDSVRDGGPLVPFVLVEHEGQVALRRIVVGDPFELEASVAQAAVSAGEAAAQPGDRVVLVYDAYLRMNDERFDAIYAEGAENGLRPRSSPSVQAEGPVPRARRQSAMPRRCRRTWAASRRRPPRMRT